MTRVAGGTGSLSRWLPSGTVPSGATLTGVRRLQTDDHQGQRGWGRKHGALLLACSGPRLLGRHAQLAVAFVEVVMLAELLDPAIGLGDLADAFGSKEGGQPVLPEKVEALDLTLRLGAGGVQEGEVVEFERRAQLGEGLGLLSEEEAVAVHVEGQRQAAVGEGGRQEIEVGQERFPLIESGAGDQARAVIDQIQQRVVDRGAGKPRMRGGVQLPELADGWPLPALDYRLGARRPGMNGEVVLLRPATPLRPGQPDTQPPVDFAGRKTGGGRRTGGKEFAEQVGDGGHPCWMTRAAGGPGRPLRLAPLRTGAQVVMAKLVATAAGELELFGHRGDRDLTGPQLRQPVADEGDAVPVD